MKKQIEARQTDRGWLAILPAMGIAAHADTREQAVREVQEGAELVERLAARWSLGATRQASRPDLTA